MRLWDDAFAALGVVSGQVLLTPYDFVHRSQYLHARQTLERLLELGVVPVINENDAIASDEIRFGDNDRISALVAHLVRADLLLLLTDIDGIYTGDPRSNPDATLIADVEVVDDALEAAAGGVGSARGSGGMASKVRAARIASFSGVRVVIANASVPDVVSRALAGESVGTNVRASDRRLSARKLWIGFAANIDGRVEVDDGAARAVRERGSSLLPAGVRAATGSFDVDDCIEIVSSDGVVIARGLARLSALTAPEWMGKRTHELEASGVLGVDQDVVVHRDDLVIL
jgi:glutamate 5-kinase